MLKTAIVITALGLLSALAGWLMLVLMDTPDANIGAGALWVIGWWVAGIGAVLTVIALLLRVARRSRA
ncbi:hypothetical protein EYE40_09325 [Glaciihabitans arcticus]|uniref:Uncharacterized protein n=1 Tax=Glaciihabitans arcticus TaxID=2668039 RepID=A0A4Q9GSD8_9MICO|nr:hypothetical protein [Glaciihabitans arcticus]TBN57571.1 hypothetical protein EYE40_09325 [Glaciihabitans arcticus]